MDLRDFSDMGNQIKDIVQEAVDTMNFQQLSRDISQTVNDTFKKSKGFYYQPKDENGRPIYSSKRPEDYDGSKDFTGQQGGSFGQADAYSQNGQFYNTYNQGGQSYQGNAYGQNGQSYQGNMYGENSQSYQGNAYNQGGQSFQNNYNYGQDGASAHRGSYRQSTQEPRRTSERYRSSQSADSFKYPSATSASVYDVGFPVLKNPPGRISSVLMMSLGYTFGAVFGIAELTLLICGFTIHDASLPLFATALGISPLFIASVASAWAGTVKHGRIRRYKAYLKALKGRTFASFKELASKVGKSAGFIHKDIRWMITKGYFPEGHIDEQKTCVMVTNDIYQQYLETQNNVKNQQAQAKQKNTEPTDSESAELKKIAEDGQHYMQRIREANDAIPDTEISNKLYRMELIVEKIFDYVKDNPDQIPQLRRFMDYYMPTTDKLVTAYKEFDTQPIQGENIKAAKIEIAKTLDTINIAYEKLYDSMYREAAMDVSSDIAVLQTLLAQEGLTQNVFEKGVEK